MKSRHSTSRGKAKALAHVAGVLVLSLGLSGFLWTRLQGFPDVSSGDLAGSYRMICWALALAGIAGTVLASFGWRVGWLLLFGLQPVWIAYALATGQTGLILGSAAYAVAQLNGFLRGTPPPAPEGDRAPAPGGLQPGSTECAYLSPVGASGSGNPSLEVSLAGGAPDMTGLISHGAGFRECAESLHRGTSPSGAMRLCTHSPRS
jgi:hypothetical protein